jgi:WD40 repeat protein
LFVGFAEGGKVALISGRHLQAWDLGTAKEPFAGAMWRGELLSGVSGTVIGLSPDGKIVVIGGWSGQFRLFDLATGGEIKPFLIPPTNNAIRAVFTPDGKQLILLHTDMRTMALWDLTSGREVRRFQGHQSPVDAIAVSPDGKTLVSSGTPRAMIRQPPPGFQEDTVTRVWDVASGKELRQIPGREGTLAFSPDGTLLAAGTDGSNSAIRLLDAATGTELRRMPFPRYGPFRIVFSHDGKTLASVGRDQMVRLFEVATGAERRHFEGHNSEVYSVAFSPDGRRLLSGGADTTAILWDVYAADGPGPTDLAAAVRGLEGSDAAAAHHAVCALVRAADKAVPVLAAAIRPAEPADPQRLAQLIADLDAERFLVREQATTELAKLEDGAEPALRRLLAGKPRPEARRRAEKLLDAVKVQVSPTILRGLRAVEVLEAIHTPAARRELERLAAGAPGVRLTREARAALDRLSPHSAPRWSPPKFELPADIESLLGGDVAGGVDGDGKLLPPWAVARLGRPRVPGRGGTRYTPSSDARAAIAHGYELPTVRVLDLPSGRERHAVTSPTRSHWLSEVALSPDRKRLAADSSSGPERQTFLYLWDLPSGLELWRASGGITGVGTLAWSPDGRLLATSGGEPKAVRLWDASNGKELCNWPTAEHYVRLVVSEDGKLLAAGGSRIRVWDVTTGQVVREFEGAQRPGAVLQPAAFTSDGQLLIGSGERGLFVWATTSAQLLRVIDRAGGVGVALSSDDRSVLTGSIHQVRLWELATGKVRADLAAHPQGHSVFFATLARDGRSAASSDNMGLLFVWDLTGLAPDGQLAPVTLSESAQDGLWQLLAGDDAAVAYRAGWRLTAGGDESVAFLKDRLAPVPRDIGRHVNRLIAELGAPDESVRQAATENLERIGELAAPAMRAALAKSNGEARDRLDYLLEQAERAIPRGERVRAIRAIEILERIGTPAARGALKTLADGHPEATITREAAGSNRRLERR